MIGDRKQGGIMRALLLSGVSFNKGPSSFELIFISSFVELDVCDVCDVCSVSVHVTVNLNHEYNL